ncbi:MAG TPA: hypothetical protein PK051_10100, partial [Trichococcus flocculiformis]|nr:hypothetical protein [Trichococcus flocculiformis]
MGKDRQNRSFAFICSSEQIKASKKRKALRSFAGTLSFFLFHVRSFLFFDGNQERRMIDLIDEAVLQ